MIRMALHQSSYDLRAFIRNRQSQFFTLALPVLFLVIFASLFGSRGQHHRGRRRADQHLGVLRARHHRARGDRGMLRQPGGLGDRTARTRRAETAARDTGPGRCRHRRPRAHGHRHRGRHVRGAAGHRLGRLRRPRPRPHRPRARGHRGDRSGLILLPGLRAHLADPQRGRRAAHHPGAPAAAVFHLRGVRRRQRSCRTGWPTWERSSPSGTWPMRCSSPTTRTPPGSGSPAWTC